MRVPVSLNRMELDAENGVIRYRTDKAGTLTIDVLDFIVRLRKAYGATGPPKRPDPRPLSKTCILLRCLQQCFRLEKWTPTNR